MVGNVSPDNILSLMILSASAFIRSYVAPPSRNLILLCTIASNDLFKASSKENSVKTNIACIVASIKANCTTARTTPSLLAKLKD